VIAGDSVVDLNLGDVALSESGEPANHLPLSVDLADTISSPHDIERARRIAEWAENSGAKPTLRDAGVLSALDDVQLVPPILAPGKIICLGRNYADHAAEAKMDLPAAPELFAKFSNSLIGAGEEILLPPVSNAVDYEAELAYVIGKRAKFVGEADALDYVLGYTIVNDVSVRDYQMQTSQWLAGKTMDRTTPIGPWIVTRDEIPDPQALEIRLDINGETMQAANTAEMLFSVAESLSFISSVLTLEPGDIISTGTPDGVGFTREPPRYLRDGEVVNVHVAGIGTLSNPVTTYAGDTTGAPR
jgi:acylpyruvate hydrolase